MEIGVFSRQLFGDVVEQGLRALGVWGEMRTPVRSSPTAAVTAATTSIKNRLQLSMLPP
ncbi:MAG TPA: hypothetical protein VGY14_05705 [Methyloceanibacter sp.]|jgi:hypothetical protein|nr:hypothetical protein [Methyloceanibacter sp.]